MVKREKSPEIVEDVRIYVAWMPFPLNANLDLEEDRKACALWVIEIVGHENLTNIYHKPSSRGMILLEISKSYQDTKCLLGEHKWSKFLRDPQEEEKVNTTRVYYSSYSTTRAAQKDGWRTVTLPTKWFRNWSKGKGRFVKPLPKPSYCLLPPEDRTGRSICRHLPAELRPPQAQAEASRKPEPVVGSSVWVTQNMTKGPGTSVNSSKTTKQNVRLVVSSPTSPILSRSATEKNKRTAITSRNSSQSQTSGPSASTVDFPKGRPMPLQQFRSQDQSLPVKKAWATSAKQSSSTTVGAEKSPILEGAPKKPQNPWARPPLIVLEKPAKVIAPVTGSKWDEHTSATSWFDMVEEEGIFDTTGSARATSPGSRSSPHDINANDIYGDSDSSDNEEQLAAKLIVTSLEKCISSGPSNSRTQDSAGASDTNNSSPISADTADDSEGEDQERKNEIQCPSHGKICPKKICRDYKKLEWERKKQAEKAEREARKKKREEREARRAERRLRGENQEKAGSSKNSDSDDDGLPSGSSSDPSSES